MTQTSVVALLSLLAQAAGATATPAPAPAKTATPAATATPAPAAGGAADALRLLPISIDWDQSDTVRTGAETKLLLKGNVMARQGDVSVRADRVEATYLNTPRQISRIVAEGEVTVTWGTKMGRADRAEFDNAARTIKLVGAPTVVEEWGILAAREITLHLDEGRVECENCSIDVDPTRVHEMTRSMQGGPADR